MHWGKCLHIQSCPRHTFAKLIAKSLHLLLSLSVYLRLPPSLSFSPFPHLWGRKKNRRTLKNQNQEPRDQSFPFRRAQEWNLDLVWGKCPGWFKAWLWSMNGPFVWLGNCFILFYACCQGFQFQATAVCCLLDIVWWAYKLVLFFWNSWCYYNYSVMINKNKKAAWDVCLMSHFRKASIVAICTLKLLPGLIAFNSHYKKILLWVCVCVCVCVWVWVRERNISEKKNNIFYIQKMKPGCKTIFIAFYFLYSICFCHSIYF